MQPENLPSFQDALARVTTINKYTIATEQTKEYKAPEIQDFSYSLETMLTVFSPLMFPFSDSKERQWGRSGGKVISCQL